jgi:peroxiredoxin (alkyl hydroperoxide reductase subunit C)
MSLVGKQFPNVTVKAMDEMGDTLEINVLDEAVKNKQKVLLFWYPKDFTFVCPTEIHAFQSKLEEFANRG